MYKLYVSITFHLNLTGYDERLASEVLELPYSGESMAMYILLPFENGEDAFDHLITTLNTETFDNIVNNTGLKNVDISIPKFNMDSLVENELIQVRANITTF